MANNRAAATALLFASLLVAAVAFADARPTAQTAGYAATDAISVQPTLFCDKVHGVQTGETCFAISQGSGLTGTQFLGFNPNINCNAIFVGQWVCLHAIEVSF